MDNNKSASHHVCSDSSGSQETSIVLYFCGKTSIICSSQSVRFIYDLRDEESKMRLLVRRWVPLYARKKVYVWKKSVQDYLSGVRFASRSGSQDSFSSILVLDQKIAPSKTYDRKVHNLKLAADQIQRVVLKPKQVFSFHRVVGEASAERGYKKSRSLHNGALIQTYGGGLCQLSGLLYQASLQLGLDVVERHNHSIDIYTEENRYAPLGSDATIAYPFKDMRIQNNSPYSLRFRVRIADSKVSLVVESTGMIVAQEIVYQAVQVKPQKVVHTKNIRDKVIAISRYEPLS